MEVYARNNVHIVAIKGEYDRILARALLWYNVTDEDGKGDYTVLDRCYGTPENVVKMKSFAKSQGFIHRKPTGGGPTREFCHPERGDIELELYVHLKEWDVKYWPYLDTFQYYIGEGVLTNCPSSKTVCRLDSTSGDGPNNQALCSHCGGHFRHTDVLDVGGRLVCSGCIRSLYKMINGSYYHQDDIHLCGVCRRYRLNEDVTRAHDGKYVCVNCLDDYVLIDGTLYNKNELTKCECCQQVFVIDEQDITHVENGGVICDSCRDTQYEYIEEKDMYFIKEGLEADVRTTT
jgi:hypothetical protein